MPLSKDHIIKAALDLLNSGGLEAVTLRQVAKRLDVQAPALYWYINNKQQLVDEMADAILRQQFTYFAHRLPEQPWQPWLTACMQALRQAMLAYPEGARVVAGAHLDRATALAQISDMCLASLLSADIEPVLARRLCLTCIHFTFGYVIEEQASPSVEDIRRLDLDQFMAQYPALKLVIEQVQEASFNSDQDFVACLQLILANR